MTASLRGYLRAWLRSVWYNMRHGPRGAGVQAFYQKAFWFSKGFQNRTYSGDSLRYLEKNSTKPRDISSEEPPRGGWIFILKAPRSSQSAKHGSTGAPRPPINSKEPASRKKFRP